MLLCFFSRYPVKSLTDLPDLILIHILQHLSTEELLLKVNRTCKRLNEIINSSSRLWRYVAFSHQIIANGKQLNNVFKHSSGFWTFLIPCAILVCTTPTIDLVFVNGFSRAHSLYWLNITDCELSTLCFLKFLPNLEILNLSGCKRFVDEDFVALKDCKKINQLYLSFTAAKSNTVLSLCCQLELNVLDICDIALTLTECDRIMNLRYNTLTFLHLTLAPGLEEAVFRQNIETHYPNCLFALYRRQL